MSEATLFHRTFEVIGLPFGGDHPRGDLPVPAIGRDASTLRDRPANLPASEHGADSEESPRFGSTLVSTPELREAHSLPLEGSVEITPEMIEAGMEILAINHLDLVAPDVDRYPQILRTVFEAMEEARRSTRRAVR